MQAEREFGDIERVSADLRAIAARMAHRARRASWWKRVGQDIRISWRSATRDWALTLLVIVTFAFGVGANTVIFSFVSGVLLRPLQYDRPQALATVWLHNA